MTCKTSDETTLYTWAVGAVLDNMETKRGFSHWFEDGAPETTVVRFEKSETQQYVIVLPKFDSSKHKASEPFTLDSINDSPINSGEKFVIPPNTQYDQDGIRSLVVKWLDALLPKQE